MLAGKVQMRQHVGLAVVDKAAELGAFPPELVGDVAQRLGSAGASRLDEGLAQGRRRHALLRLRDIGQGVAHPVDAGAVEQVGVP